MRGRGAMATSAVLVWEGSDDSAAEIGSMWTRSQDESTL